MSEPLIKLINFEGWKEGCVKYSCIKASTMKLISECII